MVSDADVVKPIPRSRAGRVVPVVIGVSVVASILGGVLWGALAPAQQLLVVAHDRGAALTGESLHRFDALALFVLVSVALGFVLPVGWWQWRSERGPRLFAAILIGAVAGSVSAMWVGNAVVALRFPKSVDPPIGSIVTVASDISTPMVLIAQALTASVVVLLLAAMNPNDDLQHTDSEEADEPLPPPSFDSRQAR